jgi:hypothetical protein
MYVAFAVGRIAVASYGAGFDRRTEEHVSEAGLEVTESRFVVDDLIKLNSVRAGAPARKP